jgi:hypothetical protein
MTVPAEAPMCVVGHQIDVRREGDPDWHTLSQVATAQFLFAGIDYGSLQWELRTEVFPFTIQEFGYHPILHDGKEDLWL